MGTHSLNLCLLLTAHLHVHEFWATLGLERMAKMVKQGAPQRRMRVVSTNNKKGRDSGPLVWAGVAGKYVHGGVGNASSFRTALFLMQ